jgi:glutathione peroxidase
MIARRQLLRVGITAAIAGLSHRSLLPAAFAAAPDAAAGMSRVTAYGFAFKVPSGPDMRLSDYAGRPLLVVNTASLCGFTPQYAGLQALWTEFGKAGLMLIGVPSNDFGGQEPGGAADIDKTAHGQYGVTFPIVAKTTVRGPDAHPFYRWAAAERPRDLPGWNFHKYLVGRDGHIADVFSSVVEPTDTRVRTAIGRALASA